MQWTKQRKIVGAVLVLAVAAFVVDRWVIGHDDDDAALAAGPAGPRHGSVPTRRATPAQRANPAPAATEASLGSAAKLATRLNYVARTEKLNVEQVTDAFHPPASWGGTTVVATPDELAISAGEFASRKLMAVSRKQNGDGFALVNDKTVAVGASLDGFRLVAVKDRSAVFRRGSQRVELRLVDNSQQGAGTSEKTAGVDGSR